MGDQNSFSCVNNQIVLTSIENQRESCKVFDVDNLTMNNHNNQSPILC